MKKTLFTNAFFTANRQSLRELSDASLIVIAGNGMLQRNSDSTFPFRQDSSFWYFTGIEEPNALLVMAKDKEYIVLPERGEYLEIFEGSVKDSELSSRSGIATVLSNKAGLSTLKKDLRNAKTVGTLVSPKAFINDYGMYINPARIRLQEELASIISSEKLVDIRNDVSQLRCIKQPEELTAMRSAILITSDALGRVQQSLGDFTYEYQIDAAITHAFLSHNAKHAYGAIIASGGNATILHYMDNNAKLSQDDLVLLDVGAEVENYAADITRVFAVGDPTERQTSVHQAVIEAQKDVFELLKPGISIKQLETKTQIIMETYLRGLSLLPKKGKTVRDYYPHAISHFLGLDVHDMGDYHAPLKPGMVITVEPGIYISEENIGIRIEDNVLITENGYEVMSNDLPRSLR